MKKILLFAVCSLIATISYSQKVYAWWDVGAKLGYGLTGMLNNNLFDDRDYEHRLTTGLSYGAKAGMYFGLFNGITVDAMFSSNKQKFDYNFSDGKNYLHNVNWKNLDIAVLYRNQRDGVYIELGPQISLIQKVTNEDLNPNSLFIKSNVTEYYNKNYLSAIFGVGGYIFNSGTFTTMLGFRVGYGFGEMVNDAGKVLHIPTPNEIAYKEKPTTAAFAQIVLEANFALGYYGKTSCSKRATLFSF